MSAIDLFAGAGGAIGDVIAQAIKPTRGRINSLGSDTGEDVVRSSGVGEQQLLDFGEEVFEENASVVQRITKNDNEIINLSAEKTILKKLKAELLESKQLDLELGPTIGPPKPNQKTSRSLEIAKITKEIKSIDKKIKNIIIKQQPKERANIGIASFLKGIKNYFFATFIGMTPQIFIGTSLGSGIEKIINQNEQMPTFFDILTSKDIYYSLLAFILLIIISIFLKKKIYK